MALAMRRATAEGTSGPRPTLRKQRPKGAATQPPPNCNFPRTCCIPTALLTVGGVGPKGVAPRPRLLHVTCPMRSDGPVNAVAGTAKAQAAVIKATFLIMEEGKGDECPNEFQNCSSLGVKIAHQNTGCPGECSATAQLVQSRVFQPPREGGLPRCLGTRSHCYCCLDPIPH